MLDREIFMIKSIVSSGSPPKQRFEVGNIIKNEEPRYMKKTKCEGDYCNLSYNINERKQNLQDGKDPYFSPRNLPCGYIRDSFKLISF